MKTAKVFDLGRTKVRVYGGLNTIGGNCVVVESPSMKVMFDQGVNFTQLKRFYGFLIQPDSVEELREMRVLPPREAYEGVDEIYISHLHLDHLGSLNIPVKAFVYLPSRVVAEALSKAWWASWRQQLFPQTLSFTGFKDVEESKKVRYARVTHSAFPSFAFRVDTEDASILYTGDLRLKPLHSVLGDPVEGLKGLAEDGVDLAIVEGTNFGRRMNYLTPAQFKALFKELLERYGRDLLFISAHPLDLEATLIVLELLWESRYTPIFENAYYAYLLDVMVNAVDYPLEEELVFAPRSTSGIRHLDNFELEYLHELRDRRKAVFIPITGIKDVKDIVELLNERSSGLLYISVLGEPFSEEWVIEERKVGNWLKLLGVTGYRLHLSGHYHPYEFRELVELIKPKRIIPIHTESPEALVMLFNALRA